MSNTLFYELNVANIAVGEEDIQQLQYIRCTPPARLKPKGTVILLHDFFRTSYQFRYVVDLFAMGGYHVFAPDLPSRSASPPNKQNTRFSIGVLASLVAQFFHHLHIKSAVHLIGCGFGAQLALRFSAEYPEKVASLTCCQPIPSSPAIVNLQHLLELPISSTKETKLIAFKKFLVSDHAGSNDTFQGLFKEDIEEYMEAFSEPYALQQMQTVCRNTITDTNNQSFFSQLLSQAKKPNHDILLLQPGNDVPSTSANDILSKPSEALTVKHIEGSFISIPEEQPEHFAVAALSFLHSTLVKSNATKQITKSARL